jgi:hypothetical protein
MDVLDATKMILHYVFHAQEQITLITQVFASHAILAVKVVQQIRYAQPVIQASFCLLMEIVTAILDIPAINNLKTNVLHATQAIDLIVLVIVLSISPATAILGAKVVLLGTI